MVIVSQSKSEIINFDNVFSLYVDTWISEDSGTEPDCCWCIKAEKAQDNLICQYLGEYKTEERAKEVLQELTKAFVERRITKDAQKFLGYSSMPEDTYFEMPEK